MNGLKGPDDDARAAMQQGGRGTAARCPAVRRVASGEHGGECARRAGGGMAEGTVEFCEECEETNGPPALALQPIIDEGRNRGEPIVECPFCGDVAAPPESAMTIFFEEPKAVIYLSSWYVGFAVLWKGKALLCEFVCPLF